MRIDRFDAGRIHADQRARLGIEYTDHDNERWGYIRIREAMAFGEIVRASKTADLLSQSPGEVSAASPVGSDVLHAENDFIVSSVTQDLTGAIGFISEGAGAGQIFYIIENTDDRAKVFVLTGNTNRSRNRGWAVALTTGSRFDLLFPGEGRQGDGTGDFVEGVIQYDATAADIGKFCWVKRSGLSPVKFDVSGTDATAGGDVVPAAGGLAVGASASSKRIGKALAGTDHLTADGIAMVNLDIPTGALSYNFSDDTNGYNEVTIR